MTATLADGNVLIALSVESHIHHWPAREWLASHGGLLATCPITQGSLLRALLREGLTAGDALRVLVKFQSLPRHRFWPDAIGYDASTMSGVIGHRQVTDAYLVALARHFNGSLVTLDRALAALHPDTVVLIPT